MTDPASATYSHLIIDSSLGDQDVLSQWVSQRNSTQKYPHVQLVLLAAHLGAASKRSIALDNLSESTRFVIELEDDVCIQANDRSWLSQTAAAIDREEKIAGPCYWDFNAETIPWTFTCAGSFLSRKTRDYIGPFPSQVTGDYVNVIEEMFCFPEAMKHQLFNVLNLPRIGNQLTLGYDLASISSNYVNEVRNFFKSPEDLLSIPREKQLTVFNEIYNRFLKEPKNPIRIAHSPFTATDCITRTLSFFKKKHVLLPIHEYQWLRHSYYLNRTQINRLREQLNNPDFFNELYDEAIVEINGGFFLNLKKSSSRKLLTEYNPNDLFLINHK